VVVQTGTRHGSAFVTATGGGACTGPGRPGNAAPVVGGSSDRYWDEDGLRTGRTIVKFYDRYAAGTFPFVPLGTVVAVFDAGQLSSAGRGSRYGATTQPAVVPLPSYTPPAGGSPILWGAAVLRLGDTVYVYGTQSPHVSDPLRQLYLARVPVSQLTEFSAWRFYAGAGTWATGQQSARPVPLPSASADAGPGFGRGAQVRAVRSGPPDDPGIARRNPAQWFDSWGLRHGCPHIPAVTSVHASAGSGQVRLSWPDAGLGVRYLVYLQGPGHPAASPVTTTYHHGVTVSGLQPGSYVARVVPANVRKYRGRDAKVTFTVP
jgi:hypothetical protein